MNLSIKAPVIKMIRPWEDQLREGRLTVTPALAEKILNDANYVRQRRVNQQDVMVYAEMMRRGLWELSDPITFARLHGNLVLVNGQHRLHAVVACGRDIEFRIAVNDCAGPEELQALYYRFDTVMRRRTQEQIINAVGLADESGVSKTIAKATFHAVGVIANGMKTPHAASIGANAPKLRIIDLRLESCGPYWEAARSLDQVFTSAQTELKVKLTRAQTFAVALLTMKYQPEKASPFWQGVAENDGLKRSDVRHVFVRDLLTRAINAGTADQGIVAAAIAWNAWYEERPIKIIRVSESAHLRIAGTPIGSRRG